MKSRMTFFDGPCQTSKRVMGHAGYGDTRPRVPRTVIVANTLIRSLRVIFMPLEFQVELFQLEEMVQRGREPCRTDKNDGSFQPLRIGAATNSSQWTSTVAKSKTWYGKIHFRS